MTGKEFYEWDVDIGSHARVSNAEPTMDCHLIHGGEKSKHFGFSSYTGQRRGHSQHEKLARIRFRVTPKAHRRDDVSRDLADRQR